MSLLNHDLLVIDQVTSFMSNDFAIRDGGGTPVGRIATEGSTLGRMFMGSRQFTVFDTDGSALLKLHDTRSFGRERMQILDGQGQPLAQLVKRLALLKTRLSLDLEGAAAAQASVSQLELTGNAFAFDFQITSARGVAATVARSWSGLSNALLGRSRYVVNISTGVPPAERMAVLGSVIALDLIRLKEQNSG